MCNQALKGPFGGEHSFEMLPGCGCLVQGSAKGLEQGFEAVVGIAASNEVQMHVELAVLGDGLEELSGKLCIIVPHAGQQIADLKDQIGPVAEADGEKSSVATICQ